MDNDLEDGEIEDDDEEIVEVTEKENVDVAEEKTNANCSPNGKVNKTEEKLANRSHRDRRRDRSSEKHYTKDKGSRKRPVYEPEDDWAGDVEKAIAQVIKKKDSLGNTNKSEGEKSEGDSQDERRRGKKRKRRERAKERKKKHRPENQDKPNPPGNLEEEIDEDELLCIRGGSPKPPPKPPVDLALFPNEDPNAYGHYADYDSYSSDYDSEPYVSPRRSRRYDRDRDRKNRERDRSREGSRRERKSRSEKSRSERSRSDKTRTMAQDSLNICLFYMNGKCHKGEECPYSHAAVPNMKLELCKFYLMECCAKRDKCLYMHSEFPCKYYHTGLRCINGERGQCKFAHGAPLNENLKQVLLKHLEMAPKEILGDFPRLSRDGAQCLVNATQKKLEQQYGTNSDSSSSTTNAASSSNTAIPSLFELNISLPQNQSGVETTTDTKSTISSSTSTTNSHSSSKSSRSRPSRWGSEKEKADVSEIISKLLPTTKTISDVGISPAVSSVYNTLNVQDQEKLRQYQLNFSFPGFYSEKDQDMRVTSNGDIDMRSLNIPQMPAVVSTGENNTSNDNDEDKIESVESQQVEEKSEEEKAMADLDLRQFPVVIPSASAPPLMLDSKDDSSKDDYLNDSYDDERELQIDDVPLEIDMKDEDEKPASDTDELPSNLPLKQRELFLRIKAQQKENMLEVEKKNETNDSDDKEDDWYSDDEDDEDDEKNKSNKDTKEEEAFYQPPEIKMMSIEPLTLQSSNSINTFSELSKVDISAKVTQLLSLVKSQAQASVESSSSKNIPVTTAASVVSVPAKPEPVAVLSDPRSLPRDPRQQPASGTSPASRRDDPRVKRKLPSPERVHPISIYEMGSLEPLGDVDLRAEATGSKDFDMRLAGDLRNSRSDVDLRSMSLPFKAMPNYVPATEIDASINSHAPMVYRVHICDIPRPDYSGLKLNAKDAQASSDPRIRKIFRLSSKPPVAEIPEIASPEPMTSPKASIASPPSVSQQTSRVDPRMQRKAATIPHLEPEPITSELDYDQQLQLLHNSTFYMGLTSNQKLILNQAIATQKLELQGNVQKPKQLILETILANLGLSGALSQAGQGMMNPAMSFMSTLFAGGNFNQNMAVGGGPNMGPSSGMGMVPPSLLGPGPAAGMNMPGPMQGMNDDFHNMGGNYGNMRPGNVGGLLGHSPFQQNMPMGGGGPNFNMGPDADYPPGQFNPEFGNQYFGGNSGNNDFNNGPNKRNDRPFRSDRPNRRGRGGNWNAGSVRHQGNRGNFPGRNRNNRSNRTAP